jgi:flagellum-specific ATP synthase
MRAILDGHIVLSRSIAARGHWPAIDVLHSVSRLANALRSDEQKAQVDHLRAGMGAYQSSADLIELGAYEKGTSPLLDSMITLKPQFDELLKQRSNEHVLTADAWKTVRRLSQQLTAGAAHAG